MKPHPGVTAIAVSGLVKRYGDFTALAGVGFEVAEGQVTALLGPNGVGKTTTIEILEGFQAPTAGTVRVLGADPRTAGRAWRARIGLVLQSTSLDAQLTVTESLQLFGGLYPRPRRVADVLEVIDLAGDARKSPDVVDRRGQLCDVIGEDDAGCGHLCGRPSGSARWRSRKRH